MPAAPPRDLEGLPPGLARERTSLAWSRTVIAFAAVGGAILKTSITAGVIVIALGVLIWGLVRILPDPARPGASPVRLLVVALAVTGVALAALGVAVFGHARTDPPHAPSPAAHAGHFHARP